MSTRILTLSPKTRELPVGTTIRFTAPAHAGHQAIDCSAVVALADAGSVCLEVDADLSHFESVPPDFVGFLGSQLGVAGDQAGSCKKTGRLFESGHSRVTTVVRRTVGWLGG